MANDTDTDVSIINMNEGQNQRGLSPLPLEPGHVEIAVSSRTTSPSSPLPPRLHYGALNKAVNVLFKKSTSEDGTADPSSDKIKINQAFDEDYNNASDRS